MNGFGEAKRRNNICIAIILGMTVITVITTITTITTIIVIVIAILLIVIVFTVMVISFIIQDRGVAGLCW